MRNRNGIALVTLSMLVILFTMPSIARELTFEDRVKAQKAIEQVYWNHRIWPAQNPGAKPSLDEVLPDSVIRDRVTTYLQKSAALRVFWSRPLRGEQLQAEMNRMVRETKNPAMLRELFAALEDDPFLIAECLARPVLVDRLARGWYARDERFHGRLRRQAQEALARHPDDAAWMRELGGEFSETEWKLVQDRPAAAESRPEPSERFVIDLDAEGWRQNIRRLAAAFPVGRLLDGGVDSASLLGRIPLNRISSLTEEDDRFVVTALLSSGSDRIQTSTVVWNKRSFDDWWSDVDADFAKAAGSPDAGPVTPPLVGYAAMQVSSSGCIQGTWDAIGLGLPEPRAGHTAVWTGTEMIVWGGESNTGFRYAPATDSWVATSTRGTPSGRASHTAVWTGTEMIVWGGDGGGPLNTGGRYNPATDSWAATSTGTGTPTGRSDHTAVWTGMEMIVWGGYDGGDLNTGGRYNPATDRWAATSIGAATPMGRIWHTAVWTGTEMIVWGGDGGGPLNTGGRYDPATDNWVATSTEATTPSGRYGHTAVWTGTEMIVWGGYGGGWDLNTGGRYDPATDSWVATSTGSGTPSGRYRHRAVWTGTRMIVWGGHLGWEGP